MRRRLAGIDELARGLELAASELLPTSPKIETRRAASADAEQRDASLVPPAVEYQKMGAVQEERGADQTALLKLEADQYGRQAAKGGTAALPEGALGSGGPRARPSGAAPCGGRRVRDAEGV